MAACASSIKRITLELGDNDSAIVCEDVDIDATAAEVTIGAWSNTGQMCGCTKRIYVHESIYNKFLQAMIEFTKKLSLLAEGESMLGPVQNQMQFEKVQEVFEDSRRNEHKFGLGDPEPKGDGKGYCIQPTIIDNPPSDSAVWKDEPFGPIVPIQLWSDEKDVINRAND